MENRGGPYKREVLYQLSWEYKGFFHPAWLFLTRVHKGLFNKGILVKHHFLLREKLRKDVPGTRARPGAWRVE